MNVEAITLHLQENGIAYFLVAVVIIPLAVVFRRYTLPFLYHTAEYAIYCAVAHTVIGGLTRAFSWFRAETAFKSYSGQLSPDFVPMTTPLNMNFWQRSLYSPQWLFWFEIAVALLLVYVVIFIRPAKFKQKPYVSKKPKPGQISSGNATTRHYGVSAK
jgi:hypothetical protein